MSTTILGLELKRLLRDRASLFFTAVLPAFFYVIFGAIQDYGDERVGNGNVAMTIMIAMAAYGAVTATVNTGGRAATERMQGWGRQLGLTPLTDREFVTTKVALSVLVAAIPVTLVYLLGFLTGAEGSLTAWVLSAALLLLGAVAFALYGLCFGLGFGTEAALAAASGSIVILGFLGNVFIPLSGLMLDLGRLTPLYGYVALARYPLTEGTIITPGGTLGTESLWLPIVNVSVWTLIFAVVALLLVQRGRSRQ
jgi:ABC-2 type transport system permease protein